MKVLLWPSESPCLDHNVLFWHDLKPGVNAQKPSGVVELKQFLNSRVKDSVLVMRNA